MDGQVGGWMGGWVEVKAVLRIAYSNQKLKYSVVTILNLSSLVQTTSMLTNLTTQPLTNQVTTLLPN
jgi:hypothetical protein